MNRLVILSDTQTYVFGAIYLLIPQ